MKIAYEYWSPTRDTESVLTQASTICEEYAAEGYDLTLRQLYYQFVARDWLPNNQRSYKRLGDIVNRGRLAGYIDWDHIVDRTRNLAGNPHWPDAGAIIASAAGSFRLDLWTNQRSRVEVWVEKEALAGVIERVARRWDVDYFSCRGYVSQSEQWRAAQRIGGYLNDGQNVTILHLGDHDPSGLDMTRDINERIGRFLRVGGFGDMTGSTFEVRRIALNIDQVVQYSPPPNPAKLTDSRAENYVDEYGYESWELDALDPRTLDALVDNHVLSIVNLDRWEASRRAQETIRTDLDALSDRDWDDVREWLEQS